MDRTLSVVQIFVFSKLKLFSCCKFLQHIILWMTRVRTARYSKTGHLSQRPHLQGEFYRARNTRCKFLAVEYFFVTQNRPRFFWRRFRLWRHCSQYYGMDSKREACNFAINWRKDNSESMELSDVGDRVFAAECIQRRRSRKVSILSAKYRCDSNFSNL